MTVGLSVNEPIVNAMSVDVEEYFQVSAFERYINRSSWDSLESRVESSTNRILDIFASANVSATFFTLGWVAERCPSLIKRIVSSGHELGCHGYNHVRVTEQSPEQFLEDVKRTKNILEDLSGVHVIGYRAASYSINKSNLWAHEILQSLGFRYSSSVYPVKHDLYGVPSAPRFPFMPANAERMIEVPVSTLRIMNINIPCGGGGYFRLFPYFLSKFGIRRINSVDMMPANFYFHPWEIDGQQPRQHKVDFKTRFRHYCNIEKVESRLELLLGDFSWNTMRAVYVDRPNEYRCVDLLP